MKKFILLTVCITMMVFVAGCSTKTEEPDIIDENDVADAIDTAEADANTLEGMWSWCGIVEEGEEVSPENAIIDEEFLEESGMEEMLDSSIVITEEGLAEGFEAPGCTLGERINTEKGFTQDVTIDTVDGEKLDEPIVITYTVSLMDGLLFIEESISDNTYDPGDVNVFRKVMD